MKIYTKVVLSTILGLLCFSNPIYATHSSKETDLSVNKYVNPFIGTSGFGNVYPGSQIPFGGIQMSPDTDRDYVNLQHNVYYLQ